MEVKVQDRIALLCDTYRINRINAAALDAYLLDFFTIERPQVLTLRKYKLGDKYSIGFHLK